ncbi:hypothetical protein MESS2_1040033 [Mesorhizobium metallidurans STM 2683]|uniref:Uncharacterized protein n=1 Tax=Mesorhizobium metallidurans STM 2683 TaxID=1297569 RepID=M5EGY8_9HYPH|nr:hypothetical protein MESS2_1040033 [Mesorhizobium metallidurans STM 2683]
MTVDRPPLRRASLDTSPPIDGGEESARTLGSLPLPPEGEVALRSSDGVGDGLGEQLPIEARNLRRFLSEMAGRPEGSVT